MDENEIMIANVDYPYYKDEWIWIKRAKFGGFCRRILNRGWFGAIDVISSVTTDGNHIIYVDHINGTRWAVANKKKEEK